MWTRCPPKAPLLPSQTQKPLEAFEAPVNTTLIIFFFSFGVDFSFLASVPCPFPALHPGPPRGTASPRKADVNPSAGQQQQKRHAGKKKKKLKNNRFCLVRSMPPHIYAFTYIFCYLCIHYSKGNVSCFTCIKLYKLEAWPDFVPRHGDAAATALAPDVPCPWGARGRCVFGPRGAAR